MIDLNKGFELHKCWCRIVNPVDNKPGYYKCVTTYRTNDFGGFENEYFELHEVDIKRRQDECS